MSEQDAKRQPESTIIITLRPQPLTNGRFAALAARIAAVASQWAGDALMPLADYDGRVLPATAEQFTEEIRKRLDRIVELANEK